MKKLLFIAALMMLGANAFAAGKDPAATEKVTVDVEVRAEITDDTFTITDIDGAPLVLNFGKSAKIDYSKGKPWTAKVEYKIRATSAADTGIAKDTTFGVELGAKDGKVALKGLDVNGKPDGTIGKLEADVVLDEDTKVMAANTTEVKGLIRGSIDDDLSNHQAVQYQGWTTLTATVNNVAQ